MFVSGREGEPSKSYGGSFVYVAGHPYRMCDQYKAPSLQQTREGEE